MLEYLFVYGTLRPALAEVELQQLLNGIKCIKHTKVRGRLYDLGKYPGAILQDDSEFIVGELLELAGTKNWLQVFDEYEGFDERAVSQSLFVRTKCCAVLPDGQSVEAWIYVYNQALGTARLIESGDYAEFVKRPLQTETSN